MTGVKKLPRCKQREMVAVHLLRRSLLRDRQAVAKFLENIEDYQRHSPKGVSLTDAADVDPGSL